MKNKHHRKHQKTHTCILMAYFLLYWWVQQYFWYTEMYAWGLSVKKISSYYVECKLISKHKPGFPPEIWNSIQKPKLLPLITWLLNESFIKGLAGYIWKYMLMDLRKLLFPMALIKYFIAVRASLFVHAVSRFFKKKNNKNKPAPLFIVNMLILNALPIITGRPKLCRLLSLQGERCLMLKMNTQKHSSVTASTAGLLIQHSKKCIKNHGQFVAVKDRVSTLIFELCIGR